jgi:hypothetical protein
MSTERKIASYMLLSQVLGYFMTSNSDPALKEFHPEITRFSLALQARAEHLQTSVERTGK